MRAARYATLAAIALTVAAVPAALAQDTSRIDEGTILPPGKTIGGPCPIVIGGVLGSGSPDWPSVSGTQTGRLNRNGVASTCAVPKACNQFDGTPGRAFDAYTFTNDSGVTACVQWDLVVITQAACNLQVNTYLGTYDPTSICANYLADPGLSSGIPPNPVGPFTANVPDGSSFVAVVHTTNPGEIGCQYTLTVSGDCIEGSDSDLSLTKSVDPPTVAPGGTITYTLTVTNNGPDDAPNTVVTDNLPAEFTWTGDDCGAGPPAGGPPNGVLTWNVGTLVNGASAVCNVTGTLDGPSGAAVVNNASAISDNDDPTPGNETAAATATIEQSVLEIPTLSKIGIGLLLLLLSGAAVWALRRSPQV